MKKMLLVILSACLIACVAFAVPPAKTSSDQFVDQFVGWLKGNKVDMSEREKEALRDTHRLLLAASEKGIDPTYFWLIVRNSLSQEIEWEKAKQMILSGQVMSVSQSHSRVVGLSMRDGRTYSTQEPKLDDVLPIVREVDPKGVFMRYKTE